MITIFSIPKAFNGHIDIIQRNAIRSWINLGHECEIVLCGNDDGTEEVAKEFKVKCIADIERNKFGTPLLSSAFEKVKKHASNDYICYVNSDIIFLSDFILSIKRIQRNKILVIGNRWNIDIKEEINFENSDWEKMLRKLVQEIGSVQPPIGADYFVFNKDEELMSIPHFAVGRPGWDNWFIYNARRRKYKVIDASKVIMAIHQNHDYLHLKENQHRIKGQTFWDGWDGKEKNIYSDLIGKGDDKCFRIIDATHILTESELKRAIDYKHLRRGFDTVEVFYPKLGQIINLIENYIIPHLRKYKRRLLARTNG
jgi:hypothetical protein